ncbi:MAG: nucleoside triphosphate pyrophosphohydrolase [candidate division WOR-3 bacterium]|nr:nucleoside triphosphate pyrophosphohydrolase [candidate division WOR-3 bacterium]MCX7947494.1 nucleoside triphosphate pyrophosphohydrolase [candidate division WOR-3 bacterium]MDW8150653.1 nucleoside triphosphate pyrophosphohydrolase [candidate division WOR-3 bacterium]
MQKFEELWKVINILREKCPWDREQTNESLKYKLIEESYEVVNAIDKKNWDDFKIEVGDILLVALMHIRIAQDYKITSLEEVIDLLIEKLIKRHPHVFSDKKLSSANEVLEYWEKSKGEELFRNINFSMPALYLAYRITQKAQKIGFDWENKEDVFDKLDEEIKELKSSKSKEEALEEIGDILFTIVNLSRHYDINPEDALRKATMKFMDRLNRTLEYIKENGLNLENLTLKELDEIWEKVK